MVLVAFSTVAGFGVASMTGLIYSPVNGVLPFVLLGIGVDDAFVIANAFDREREGIPLASEDDESIIKRGSRALGRAGASITVTSLTDLVAFAISSSSAIPALATFCAYASYCIFFLWALSATFFVSCMVIDEKRQRDNRMDCLVCFTRNEDKVEAVEEGDKGSKEGPISRYFRNYHAPALLSKRGKAITLLFFLCLLVFGVYGATMLPVEDTTRNFVPRDSYVQSFFSSMDKFFPTSGGELYITFEGGSEIYQSREALANLDTRLTNLSDAPPYISGSNYQNVMAGFKAYLDTGANRVRLGEDGWPVTYEAFVVTLKRFVDIMGPGAKYAQDVSFTADGEAIEALHVKAEYIRLTKTYRGEVLDDGALQIAAMDATRDLVNSWGDLPASFPYCKTYVMLDGLALISTELYRNVGLAIAAVGVIVLITVANIVTTLLITLNVTLCIVEILGAMWALDLVIDSLTVVNMVLAVGLSVDYSAHIG
jgi:predicted RND superfamily exporter protein